MAPRPPVVCWIAALSALGLAAIVHAAPARAAVETLTPVAALPAHIAGSFRDLAGCQQAATGDYFIFDRRAHSVYTATPALDTARKLIEIGTEPGRVLDPTAFDLVGDGTFVVADAPRGQLRVQIFLASGSTLGSFYLPGRAVPRISLRNAVMNGIAAIEYTGRAVFLNQPETGALITEYDTRGNPVRSFGVLRSTGHEQDREVHLALNAGLVVASPDGGFYFVFLAGVPVYRKYDASGVLLFERHVEGAELDAFLQELPTTWKRHATDAGEIPLVLPSIHAAGADRSGNLWVSLAVGVTYVYSPGGDKHRTVQFRAAGPLLPTSLAFTPQGRVLVTPGCYAFRA